MKHFVAGRGEREGGRWRGGGGVMEMNTETVMALSDAVEQGHRKTETVVRDKG